jgi:hypothetical protein
MTTSDEARLTWQHGRSPALRRRRWIAALGAIGLVERAVGALGALGLTRRDARRARFTLGLPVASLGAVHDAVTIVLASAADLPTSRRRPIWRILLGASVLVGLLEGRPTRLAMVPLVLPELRE